MRAVTIVAVMVVVPGFIGCTRAARELDMLRADPGLAELRLIQDADAAQALESAWQRGEKRFLGIKGLGLEIPGVDELAHEELIFKRVGVRAIEGTGDAVTEEVHELMKRATRYAERYNALLLERHLSSAGK